ncbi:MAG: hypothetical protein HY718_08915 [Planctomycetes bacterium]|nr:hypothetical protein [Planctomycetota bacterium]
MNHVDILSQNWSVDLRYRASLASPEEVEEVYRAVDWLVDRYARLV